MKIRLFKANIFIVILLLVLTSITLNTKVYVCENGKTSVFHTTQCRALNRCSHNINTITIQQAHSRGLRECKICN